MKVSGVQCSLDPNVLQNVFCVPHYFELLLIPNIKYKI